MNSRDELIRQRAYELWEKSGRSDGSEMDFWLQAERELAQEAGDTVPTTPPDLPEGKLE